MNQSFGKAYKLCGKKQISALFESGKSLKIFPFVVHFMVSERTTEPVTFQTVLSVPKRNFRKAHDRNRIRRLIREAVRKNKWPLESWLEEHNQYLALFVIYTSREELPLQHLEKKIQLLIDELIFKIKE